MSELLKCNTEQSATPYMVRPPLGPAWLPLELLEREIIIKEDSREVIEVIAKEIDDESQRRQQQKISSSSRTGSPVDRPSRPDVHNVHKLKLGRPVGRLGAQQRVGYLQSVDRPVTELQLVHVVHVRSTGPVDRSPAASAVNLFCCCCFLRLSSTTSSTILDDPCRLP